jgi:hypothetical protein
MKPFGVRLLVLTAAALISASNISCKEAPPKHATTKPGPEESFSLIYDTFNRRMQDTPIGFAVANASGGRTTMIGKYTLEKELIPPAEGQPYRAIITVTSESRYSIRQGQENADEADDEKASQKKKGESPATDDAGKDSLDPTAGVPAEGQKPVRPEEQVARREEAEQRKYELVYRDGRWTLVTELNKETEQSIDNAFRSALATQI